MGSLIALFFTAFVAATILPAQSEALLGLLIVKSHHAPWLLVGVASAGNILGSCVNWVLGRFLLRFQDRKWFPVRPAALERAQEHYRKYGRWSLLLSWVPFIGDPITVMAGVLKEKFLVFLLIVGAAKTARYAVLALMINAAQA